MSLEDHYRMGLEDEDMKIETPSLFDTLIEASIMVAWLLICIVAVIFEPESSV